MPTMSWRKGRRSGPDRGRALLIPLVLALWGAGTPGALPQAGAADNGPLVLFADGRARVYLGLSELQARALVIAGPAEDFARCFERMTGRELPRTGGKPALFDPTEPQATRFECRVVGLEDQSRYGGPNAQVGLVVSPNRCFASGPFREPGEKAGWTCTGDRSKRKLAFRLTVANQPYYGPGYGPFTFAKLEADAPDFAQAGSIRLALEMRGAGNGHLRGSYSIDDGPWVHTQWSDPTAAGADKQAPGKSDKNGPQAWGPDWPQRWAGQTAFYVTAYHPKGREAAVRVADIRVTRGSQVLFDGSATDEHAGLEELGPWLLCPAAGTARADDHAIVLAPKPGGWTTVGLRAQREARLDTAGLARLRLELTDYPAGVSHYDAHTVQGFAIEANDRGLTSRACTRLGLQNALYYLLDRWGCRWVMPGELGECIPKRTTLTFPQGVTRFSPYSDASQDRSPFTKWADRSLGGWQHWLSGQHYWFYALPPKRHFAEHPKWYSLIGGKRLPKQLCSSNPEVVAAMIEVAKKFLRERTTALSFPMDPQDNIDYCQCEDCVAMDTSSADAKGGAPSVTGRVLAFANAVADGIRDEFPDRYVAFYAYSTHIDPPARIRPADNVIVIVCRSGRCLLHLTPTDGCPTSDFHELVRSWRRLTPNIYTYEYDPISWTGGLPCPTYLSMARSLKEQFTKLGVRGSYSDGTRAITWASTYINRYMARRMKIDPTQEPDDMLRDICESFFGPAAEPMERYYRELATVTAHTHSGRTRVGGGSTFYHELFTPKMVRAARGFLDQAISACAGPSPYRERLKMVDLSQRYLEAYVDGVWSAQARRYDAAVAGFDRMDSLIDEMAAAGVIYAVDARRRAKTMRMKALAEHFSKRLGFVTRWKLLGPFDNSDSNADRVREAFEPIGSTDAPVTQADGTEVKWWDYESPGGFLNLEKAFEGRPKAWTLSSAFAATTFHAPHDLLAQLRMDSFFPFRVSVNGQEVYYRPGLNADCPDKRLVHVKMKAGANTVVFKLSQTRVTSDTFPWGLYFRVVVTGRDAVALPEQWAFKTDPGNIGVRQAWHSLDLDDRAWQRIRVPSAWEKAIGPYDGYAWYRTRVRVPAELAGTALVLKFYGADEQAWVYLNGEYLGERTTASTGKTVGEIWDQPFEVAVPPQRIRDGATNVLAVRVHDSRYAGGLFGAIRLLLPEE